MGLGIPVISDVIDGVKDLISEAVVDKDKRNEINLELARLKDEAEVRLSNERIAQIEVNKEEAKSGSVFVAGWRPFVGWVSGLGLAAQSIILPLIEMATGRSYTLDTTLLIFTLGGMLGIGGMRSFEKVKGVSTNDFTDTPKSPDATRKIVFAKPKEVVQPIPEDAPWAK